MKKTVLLVLLVVLVPLVPLVANAWEVTLKWIPPTTYADNITPINPLTDIKGYKIYYGTTSKGYTETPIIVTGNVDTFTVKGLTAKKYYFAMHTIDMDDDESVDSNEVFYKLKINPPAQSAGTATVYVTFGKTK